MDVINALGEDPDDVDRVNRREAHLVFELEVAHQLLHDGLAIVEGALDRNGENVFSSGAGHLALLQIGDAALGIENEDIDPILAGETVDGGGAGVARGRPEHIDGDAGALNLLFEKIADQLQAEVLEGKAGTMEELEHEEIVPKLLQRRIDRVTEVAVTPVDDIDEMFAVVIGVKKAKEVPGECRVGHRVLYKDVARKEREMTRHVETSIRGKTPCKCFGETDGGSASAG